MKTYWEQLNEQRLLVFLENEDGTFSQVGLDATQFKKISDAIILSSKKDDSLKEGYEMAQLRVDPDKKLPADLFEGMSSITF